MATRIRRAGLVVALTLLMATALAGAAWAATTLMGTDKPDLIAGTSKAEMIYGLDGDDSLSGRGSADELYGGRGRDLLFGRFGCDYLNGGSGEERKWGGPGLVGGPGNDRIEAADGQHDLIDCGPGDDWVSVDDQDVIGRCERVIGEPARTTNRF